MRQIKFRVWNTNLNRFMCEDEKNDNYMDVTTGKLVSNCYVVHEYGHTTEYYNDGSYILLQYTGLKDKNGIEIYEGDILSHCDCGDGRYKVIFNNDTFHYAVEAINPKKDEWDYEILEDFGDSELIEVIGNIYENPELLEY